MTFGGEDLYESIFDKAAALGYSLTRNHPFVDGNKRTGLAAMAVFLEINGFRISASNDEAYDVAIGVAEGTVDRSELSNWLKSYCEPV